MDIITLDGTYKRFYVPAFQILASGVDVLREGVGVFRVEVDDTLNGASRFSFSFNAPYDVHTKELAWVEDPLFQTGNRVELKLGYVDRMTSMLIGDIASVKLTFPQAGVPYVEVSGYDLSHRMTRSMRSPSAWTEATDSDVVRAIASRPAYELKTTGVEETGVVKHKIIQDKMNDHEFISKLAKSNGFEFFVRGETLNFRSPGNASTPAVTLKWGESLSAFSPEENLTRQVSAVEVRHWDAKTKKEIIGRAKKGAEHGRDPRKKSGGDLIESIAGEAAIEIIRKPVFSKDEADREARAALDKFAEGLITGTGHCIGIPDIRAGETIALEGIGKKFSGTYYVQKAVHTLDSSGYRTTFTVQRNTI